MLLSVAALQMLVMLVALVRSKALSLLLEPAGFGIASTIDQTVNTVVQVGALSLTFTGLKFMSRAHSEGSESFGATFATFLRALAGLAVVAAGLAAALVVLRPGIFGDDMVPHRVPLAIALIGVPAAMLQIHFINTLAAAQQGSRSALLGLLAATSLATGAVVGDMLGGLSGLYIGTVSAGLANTAGSLLYLRRHLGLHPFGRAVGLVRQLKQSREIATYSALLYVAMMVYSLTLLATRYFVLAGLGAVQAGLFQALFSLALTVAAVVGPMNNLFLTPLVNRNLPVEQKLAAANEFTGKIALLLVLAALPLILFPGLFIHALYSSRFTPAAGMLFLFIFWQCAYQLTNVYLQLLIGLDDIAWFSGLTCASYACVVALFPPLIRQGGLGGAALALACGVAVSALGAGVRLWHKFGCRISGLALGRAAFALAAIVAGGLLSGRLPAELTFAGLGVRLAYSFGVLGLLWLLLRPEERAMALRAIARVRVNPAAAVRNPSF